MAGLVLELTSIGAAAMTDLLSGVGPRGRADIRKHATLFKALNTSCRKPMVNDPSRFEITSCKLSIDDPELVEYLEDVLEERVKAGVQGNLSEGYAQLLDLIESEDQ